MAQRLCGYDGNGNVVPDEAGFLRRAAGRILAHESQAAVVSWLNAAGSRTTRGNLWTKQSFVKTLEHPRLAGLDAEGEPIPDFGETVLTPDEHRAIRAERHARASTRPAPPDAHEYLLTHGFGVCGRCGTAVIGARSTEGADPSIRCPAPAEEGATSCGAVRMQAHRAESAVAEQVLAEVLRPGFLHVLLQLHGDVVAEVERLRQYVDEGPAREATVRALRGQMVAKAHQAALAATAADLKASRERLRYLEQLAAPLPVGSAEELVAWWNAAPFASKRAVVRLVAEKVRILPAGQGKGSRDPHRRIEILWRRPFGGVDPEPALEA
ncbi:recombinase zinc beta ribbon domain-containing protein (plasmid) [Streptomyces sp. BI20]|uniref:recombinase zinc beta ribbon domain-containing protein n=1 Tax=Streptomyces sp. BI20 TaxID=3403460 RepID=UPI003C793AB4